MPNLVCWHDNRDWSHEKVCPVRALPYEERDTIWWGRCRSGSRWFWVARVFLNDDLRDEHGWSDTEEQAIEAARAAVVALAAGRPAVAQPSHGTASDQLKAINAEKRRSRPSNGGTGTRAVEYLYGRNDHFCHWDGDSCGCDELEGDAKLNYHVVRFRITKKTAKRIYYVRSESRWSPHDEPVIGYVDREEMEANGEVRNRGVHWSATDSHLYAEPPDLRPWKADPVDLKVEVSRLRAEMADAHPDRGGSNADFIAARQRYLQARARVRSGGAS